MVTTTLKDIEAMYGLLNSDLVAFRRWFAAEGQYVQRNSFTNANGHDGIAKMLTAWKGSFRDLHFYNFTVKDANHRSGEIPGATQCFYVEYLGSGQYVRTLPGLEQLALATNDWAQFPVMDVVWLDSDGQVLVMSNEITNLRTLW